MNGRPALSIGITSSRESVDDVLATVRCVHRALREQGGGADVCLLVNGNADLAQALAGLLRHPVAELEPPVGCALHLDVLELGDKAHALNTFLHELAVPAQATVLMDGYVQVRPSALRELAAALARHPDALAATGVPRTGWSARRLAATLRREGGLHGNLFAISPRALTQIRALGFRLPVGMYRVDAVLGAAIAMGLDLGDRAWDPKQHICLAEGAAWEAPTLKPWSPRDLKTYWQRRRRQYAGVLENAAVRHRLEQQRLPLADLPATAAELVERWAATAREEAAQLLADPSLARAKLELQTRQRALPAPGRAERRLSLRR